MKKTNFVEAAYNTTVVSKLVRTIIKNKLSRSLLQPKLDGYIKEMILNKPKKNLSATKIYRYYSIRSMYISFFRNYDKGLISSKVTNRFFETLLNSVLLDNDEVRLSEEKFKNKYKQLPPKFITISPTKKCNLFCQGCYASSNVSNTEMLSWECLNKIIEDAYLNMGMRFFVISGGEPLIYKNENKTILDLFEKWHDCFFLMYTNGTFINNDIAAKIASLGNVTPAISIEGFESETDKRRGKGTFNKIANARKYLIKNGVPFGLSITATKDNINILLNNKFYDFYFNDFGATYVWFFHYMPIGREFSTDLMLTPEQRIELFNIQNKLLIEKNYFIADFWNSAVTSAGCISSGTEGGYFYINWDGNIMPCVFVPYFADNIYSIYSNNKTLSDALFSKLFTESRNWQSNYLNNKGNLLMPCLYRDHYSDFFEIIKNCDIKPENNSALEALSSMEYYKSMLSFDKKLGKISSEIWQDIFQIK